MTQTRRILVTSALPYINGIKHLGNLAGSMLPADVYARVMRLMGHDVTYICATDEHGTPAELAAQAAGMSVQAYCDEKTDGLYYMCGPWGFMDVVEEALLDMGVADDKIFVERFASPKSSTPAPAAKPVPEAPKDEGGRTVTLDVFGETHVIPYDGQSYITDAAAAAGVDAPCSCEEGFCGTCIARVVEGEVEMDVQDALSKGQKARGMILACQARALSKNLKVVFES